MNTSREYAARRRDAGPLSQGCFRPRTGRAIIPIIETHDPVDISDLLAANKAFADAFDDTGLDVHPRRRLAVVTCMDSRLDIFRLLGLANGDAHIIRNAGGVITDDVIRSLTLSQRHLGTRAIVLVHHTDCGLQLVSEDEFKAGLEAELGIKPPWALESFTNAATDVRQSMTRLTLSAFIPYKDNIRGFVYDITTARLEEVT
ncbi:MAG: carbonic anhydrase [Acidimicrobiales bacterium]